MLALALLLACRPPYNEAKFTFTLANTSEPGTLQARDGTAYDADFAPGLLIVHGPSFALVVDGEPAGLDGLEALAEDGDPTKVDATLGTMDTVAAAEHLEFEDMSTYEAAPMGPGASAAISLTVNDWQHVTVAFMFGQSNDIIIAGLGMVLFDGDGDPIYGDVTSELRYYDMGTEVNQEPGVGSDQAPRQAAPATGAPESADVFGFDTTDASGFTYPAIGSVLTLSADPV